MTINLIRDLHKRSLARHFLSLHELMHFFVRQPVLLERLVGYLVKDTHGYLVDALRRLLHYDLFLLFLLLRFLFFRFFLSKLHFFLLLGLGSGRLLLLLLLLSRELSCLFLLFLEFNFIFFGLFSGEALLFLLLCGLLRMLLLP